MPVVRELINRISFQVKPGDKAKATNAFKGIQMSAAGVIAGIKAASKTALAALAGNIAAGAKLFTDFEKDTASVKFFANSNEEAEKLLQTVNKIRGSEVISRRELNQAAAVLSQLNINIDQIDKVLPVLEDISIAQPKLDFPETTQIFADFVRTGDIDALRQLGAVGKTLAEQLQVANVDLTQSVKGQVNRAQLLTSELEKQKDRISDLAEAQKETLTFGFRELAKEASDFSLKFGETTAPALKEVVNAIKEMFAELNKSESFWESVKELAEATAAAIKEAVRLARILKGDEESEDKAGAISQTVQAIGEIDEKGFIGAAQAQVQRTGVTRGEARRFGEGTVGAGIGEDITSFFTDIIDSVREFKGVKPSEETRRLGLFGNIAKGLGADIPQRQAAAQEITIRPIQINVTGENVEGLDLAGIQNTVVGQTMSAIKESFKNVAASTGRPVATGGP